MIVNHIMPTLCSIMIAFRYSTSVHLPKKKQMQTHDSFPPNQSKPNVSQNMIEKKRRVFKPLQPVLPPYSKYSSLRVNKPYHFTATLLYSTLLYSTLLYSTLLYSTLLYSTLLYSTLLYSTLLYSTLLYSTLLYSTLLYSTLLYSTLLYSTLLYSTLLYSTLLYSTLLYSTLL